MDDQKRLDPEQAPYAQWYDKVERPDPEEFQAAMASGDLEKQLLALRKQLVFRIQLAGSRDVAPIAKELREVMALLQDMNKGEGVNQHEQSRADVARKFADLEARFAGPASPPPAHN